MLFFYYGCSEFMDGVIGSEDVIVVVEKMVEIGYKFDKFGI